MYILQIINLKDFMNIVYNLKNSGLFIKHSIFYEQLLLIQCEKIVGCDFYQRCLIWLSMFFIFYQYFDAKLISC